MKSLHDKIRDDSKFRAERVIWGKIQIPLGLLQESNLVAFRVGRMLDLVWMEIKENPR